MNPHITLLPSVVCAVAAVSPAAISAPLVESDDLFQTGLVAFGATETSVLPLSFGAATFGQPSVLPGFIRVTSQETDLGNSQSEIRIIFESVSGDPFVPSGFAPGGEDMTGLAVGVGDAQGFTDQLPFIPNPIDFIEPVRLVSIDGQAYNPDGPLDSTFGFASVTEAFLPDALAAGVSEVEFIFTDITSFGINRLDLIAVVEPLVSLGLSGDYNDSGSVEQGDLDLVLNNWGQVRPFDANAGPFATPGVDQEELDRVLNNWGNTSPQDLGVASVPEPANGIGLVGLFLSVRRRKPSGGHAH